MPASLAPITPELLADLRAGKESALEQLFRANFDALTAEVAERVEDAAAAQKVVASAYLELWENRNDAQAPNQLEALLRQLVSSGAAHELRRRAAVHRLADSDGEHKSHAAKHHVETQTTDQVWARIVGELHAVKKDAKERAREIAEHKRHEAAAHLKDVAKPQGSKIAIISGIVILAVVGVPLWYANKGAETTKAGQLLSREDARPMKSSAGQRGTVKLEDNTEVRIGSATEVKLTAHFPKDMRATQVTGAAAFKAPTDAKNPLLVHVGNAWVYVSGADVVVRSFPDDSGTAMIKATNGTVKVKTSSGEKELAAGATMQVAKDGTMGDLSADHATMAFSWIDGNFATTNMPLLNVLGELRKWYGLEILPRDSTILQRPITMTASLESSKDAIAALEASGKVKVGFEGLAMVIKDGTAAAAAPAKGKKK
jgi:ferric-dicitrate binding protein FerR (iron transport regulator)